MLGGFWSLNVLNNIVSGNRGARGCPVTEETPPTSAPAGNGGGHGSDNGGGDSDDHAGDDDGSDDGCNEDDNDDNNRVPTNSMVKAFHS